MNKQDFMPNEQSTDPQITPVPSSAKVAIIIFVGLVILLTLVVVVKLSGKASRAPQQGPVPTNVPTATDTPTLTLKTAGDRTVFAVGENMALTAFANSRGQAITGFDVALTLPKGVVSFSQATSAHRDFDIYATEKDNTLFITGVKKLSQAQQTPLDDVPIVDIALTAEKPGPVAIMLQHEKGQTRDSNLIDENTQDILGEAVGLNLLIGETVTVKKNETVEVDGARVRIRLIEVVVPEAGCTDCTESARFEVVVEGRRETVEFLTGGIAGIDETRADFAGYRFEQQEVAPDQLTLHVAAL